MRSQITRGHFTGQRKKTVNKATQVIDRNPHYHHHYRDETQKEIGGHRHD